MATKKIEFSSRVHEIDDELDAIEARIDWPGRLTPNNLDHVWEGFRESGFKAAPDLAYDDLPDDIGDLRAKLLALDGDNLGEPLLEPLMMEKQSELDRQIELVRLRDKPGFVDASLALFGNVDDELLERARQIRDEVPVMEPNPRDADADDVVEIAKPEMRWYAERCERFDQKVVKDPNPGTQLFTSQGNFHVACDYKVPRGRIVPLLAHEIGTHTVTRHNGKMQPLQVLACGLAGYDRLQEGLAAFAEYVCGYLPAERLRVLAARVEAAHMTVQENSLADIFACLYDDYKLDEHIAFATAARAKRGGGLTKDALYLRGLVELLAYLGDGGDFEVLFIGKFALDQLDTLETMLDNGMLHPPEVLPRYLELPHAVDRLKRARTLDVTQFYQSTPET